MAVTITEKAAEKAKEFIKDDASSKNLDWNKLYLRIYVVGGGCSGLSYGIGIEEDKDRDTTDELFEDHGLKLVVDQFSLKHLNGANIDYVDNLMGSGFKINNPNVSKSCSCGHSFSVD